jgi:ElaB/YqjD/DUF883 family membrane-anchored ribosome-binding protein
MANPQALTRKSSLPIEVEETRRQLPADQEIHQARARLSETTEQIRLKVRRTLHWREIVNRYPLLVTGLAAGTGALLGFGFGTGSSPKKSLASGKSQTDSSLVVTLTSLAVREGTKYLIDRLLKEKK